MKAQRTGVLIWLMSGLIGIGCEKKEKTDEQYEQILKTIQCLPKVIEKEKHRIVGKWKLVLTKESGTGERWIEKDYSCNQIIYHFKSDNTLIINSDHEDFPVEKFDYEYLDYSSSGANFDDMFINVLIIEELLHCLISEKYMYIGATDNHWTYTFLRIE